MTTTAIYLALDVRRTLARPLSELRGFTHPDGRPMTPRQAHDVLAEQLASGHELLPVGRITQFDFIKK